MMARGAPPGWKLAPFTTAMMDGCRTQPPCWQPTIRVTGTATVFTLESDGVKITDPSMPPIPRPARLTLTDTVPVVSPWLAEICSQFPPLGVLILVDTE